MRTLAALMSCGMHAELGYHQAIRDTWGADAGAAGMELLFFVGNSDYADLRPDEVRLDVPDNKETLMYKVSEMCRWAADRGYDHMLKVNTNTYVNVAELLNRPPFTTHTDWSGAQVGKIGEQYGEMGIHGWIQGSAGWLSKWAMEVVAAEAVDYALANMARLMRWNGVIAPYLHSEDLWIAQVLTPRLGEMAVHVDGGYCNGPVTWWSQSGHVKLYCLAEWMRAMHAARPDSGRMNAVMAEYRGRG